MIHYHGTPITPNKAAAQILAGRHGLVSFAYPLQIELVADVCHSYVLDNGAFSFWRSKKPVDWTGYYQFVEDWSRHPGFDWALIPDVIDGSEEKNDKLLEQWPFSATISVPVWHVDESLDRLSRLAINWPRVALGSSGKFAQVGTSAWWQRMADVMECVCIEGQPYTKLHGLRMLNPKIFSRLPLASADSANIARNVGIDKHWQRGSYPPPDKATRGIVMAERIESHQSASRWRATD